VAEGRVRGDKCYDRPAMRKLLILLLFLAATPAFAKEVLPFIDNDYAKALARAKAKNVPLFVDAWAPW
jgi:hypothetical protein